MWEETHQKQPAFRYRKGTRNMNEYQTAMLALQESSLALQEASVALQQAALTASHWHTGITLAVWSGLALYVFRIMRKDIEKQNAALQADRERHRKKHLETMRRMDREHAEAMNRLPTLTRGLETTIERTAPKEGETRAAV